jgi:peptidoglycan/LPS O-acetylase OafA/YrhL
MRRIPQLDSVRAVAILAVFFYHALGTRLLWMGVDLFFVLSGFLITGVLIEAKYLPLPRFFAQFYAKRARRILAPYAVTLILVSIFFGLGWMRKWYLYLFLANFVLPLRIPQPAALDPLWSLAVEEQFYLVWPFAVYFLDARRLRSLSISLIVLAPLLRGAIQFHQRWPVYTLTPFRMDLLASGALLWLEWTRNREGIERCGARLGAFIALIGLLGFGLLSSFHLSMTSNTRISNVFVFECALLVCFGFLLYALGGKHVAWMRIKPLRYIGNISYSMYLVHLGILVLLIRYLSRSGAASIGLILTIAYASLSWWLMESRLLRRKTVAPE